MTGPVLTTFVLLIFIFCFNIEIDIIYLIMLLLVSYLILLLIFLAGTRWRTNGQLMELWRCTIVMFLVCNGIRSTGMFTPRQSIFIGQSIDMSIESVDLSIESVGSHCWGPQWHMSVVYYVVRQSMDLTAPWLLNHVAVECRNKFWWDDIYC
jgi:hypothetical protein